MGQHVGRLRGRRRAGRPRASCVSVTVSLCPAPRQRRARVSGPVPTLPGRLLLPLDVGQRDALLRRPEVHQGGGGQRLQLEGGGDGFLDGRRPRERLHVHRVEVQDVAHCKDSTEPGSARGLRHPAVAPSAAGPGPRRRPAEPDTAARVRFVFDEN